jgi:hypothetical protein
MAKQFSVYLLPSDSTRLLGELRPKINVGLAARHSCVSDLKKVNSPILTEAGFSRIDCLLVPDKRATVKLDYIEGQDQWIVNTLFSEVIEFTGCHFDGKTLKRGRLFFDQGFYKTGQWHEKSSSFLSWADSIFKMTKKMLRRDPSLNAYVGQDAEAWGTSGGVFIALAIKGKHSIIPP